MHRKTSFRLIKNFCLMLMSALALMVVVPAQADIMIMPVRVVFLDHDRTADLLVVNTGEKAANFRMSWLYQKQNAAGTYDELPGPMNPAYDFSKMVVFSPRQMTLPPGARQRIRMALRRPSDMPDGEYHAHLRLRRINDVPLPNPRNLKKDQVITGMAVNIGFGIPVIIRQGHSDAAATFSEPKFLPSQNGSGAAFRVTVNRTGKYGTLGHLQAYWTPPGGNETLIGALNNFNIFTELDKRTAVIPLTESRIVGGKLRVVYDGDGPDKGTTFDEKTYPIGGG